MDKTDLHKIGLGGGCHWCTEAYFQSLKGVERVEQGWISSDAPNDSFSEAIVAHYDPEVIPLKILIAVHLHTHASTKKHSFRDKYRSAIYVFDDNAETCRQYISELQTDFDEPVITQVLPFREFRPNTEELSEYYKKHKGGAFCERYISPRLKMIESRYAKYFKEI